MPALVNVAGKLSAAEIRTVILEGKGEMPGFHQFNSQDVDGLLSFLSGAGGRGGIAGGIDGIEEIDRLAASSG